MPELNKTRVYSGSISEGFEKAKQYFKKDVGQLEYRLISSDGEGNQKYLLEFSVKSSDLGQKGELFEDVFLDDFDVVISKDKMKAFILIPPNHRVVDKNYFWDLLTENGVKRGIIEERLYILVEYLKNKNPPLSLLIWWRKENLLKMDTMQKFLSNLMKKMMILMLNSIMAGWTIKISKKISSE